MHQVLSDSLREAAEEEACCSAERMCDRHVGEYAARLVAEGREPPAELSERELEAAGHDATWARTLAGERRRVREVYEKARTAAKE